MTVAHNSIKFRLIGAVILPVFFVVLLLTIFTLNQNRSFEASFVFVVDNHLEHPARLLTFAAHIGVQQSFVTFTTTP